MPVQIPNEILAESDILKKVQSLQSGIYSRKLEQGRRFNKKKIINMIYQYSFMIKTFYKI